MLLPCPSNNKKNLFNYLILIRTDFFEERAKMLQQPDNFFSNYTPNLKFWLDQGADIKLSQEFQNYLTKNTTPEQQEQIKAWLKLRNKKSVD